MGSTTALIGYGGTESVEDGAREAVRVALLGRTARQERSRAEKTNGSLGDGKNSRNFNGRGDRIRTCDIYVPNVALYQSELHPAFRTITTNHPGFSGGSEAR
jgi:hypothetical protein